MTNKSHDATKRPSASQPADAKDSRRPREPSYGSDGSKPPAEQDGTGLARPRKRPKYVGGTPPTNNQ